MKKLSSCLILALFLAGASAFGHDAHTHGIARLNLVIEGINVEIGFETPLINLIAFERAPKNDKERQEVRNMATALRNAHTLFIFPPDAKCGQTSVLLKADVIAEELAYTANEHERGQENHAHAAGDGHADLDAEFVFTCQNPAALKQVEVRIFQAFPALKRIEAELVTPRGQKAIKLTSRANRLQW
ncbi:MAG: DUF2796 domain-containing protein [Betaproteobacteria bacterium]|nr:DUF2796 domain-containing protein [Betaproteobacteria bacterium]